jgi:hypothetical protein
MFFIILNKFDPEGISHLLKMISIIFFSIIQPLLIDQGYVDRKNEVIKAERRLLKELGFCVYVKHPHKVN